MDGTALTDWALGPVILPRDLQLIQRFTREGGRFSVASGRQWPEIVPFFPENVFGAPLVCCNGALVYDPFTGRIIHRLLLPTAYKASCLDYFLTHRHIWLAAADEKRIYQISSNDPAKDRELQDRPRPLLSPEAFLVKPMLKAAYVTAKGDSVEKLKEEISLLPGAELVTGLQSGPRYLEMMDRRASKANGIRIALQSAGLTNRILVCIGDQRNDQAMLEAADISACPANAVQAIRDLCTVITCDNNSGALGDLIQFLLQL